MFFRPCGASVARGTPAGRRSSPAGSRRTPAGVEAKAYMERAISNSDDLSEVVLEHAGDIFAKSGDMEQAMFYWQKALEKDGSNKQLKKKIKLKQYVEN